MNRDKTVTANFSREFTLITAPSPADGGDLTGAGVYVSGSSLTVVATPSPGYALTGWTGGEACSSAVLTCQVTMDGDKAVAANFSPKFTLTANAAPSVGGTVTGGGSYPSGTSVPVIATANAGYTLDEWSGACSGTGTSCTVTMDDDKTVTAHFSQTRVVPSRSITMGQEVPGTIAEAGEFEPWLLEVAEDTTVDIYMWSDTGSLDTYLWLYEGIATNTYAPVIKNNDDDNAAVQAAVENGILNGPVGGRYNSAITGVELQPGTYSLAPRSYDDSGIGDYNLMVTVPNQ
jgi:uncharacterized repeat protein (TIGR02543 family)